jgi:hypothetical protein
MLVWGVQRQKDMEERGTGCGREVGRAYEGVSRGFILMVIEATRFKMTTGPLCRITKGVRREAAGHLGD